MAGSAALGQGSRVLLESRLSRPWRQTTKQHSSMASASTPASRNCLEFLP